MGNKNFNRRKSVMSRSLKLGHCVCNPKIPCPCDNFKNFNVCQCSGEKLNTKTDTPILTKYVSKAGCASKISQAELKRIISNLPNFDDPNILLGSAAGDDAGVYKLNENISLVQTVDVFTPCVDNPYLFGQIAAANSLSDIYAMGGKPLTALSIIGFPIEDIDGKIMEEILRGGIDKLKEANCSLLGGHSINDKEIKCGFAITGVIKNKNFIKRDNAKIGDVLILTKPIGTGILSFASQLGKLDEQNLALVGQYMSQLNKDAAEIMIKYNANACTDITGFGLMGHLVEMINGSNVSVEIDMSAIPVFAQAVICIEKDILPGAIESNQEYSMAWVTTPNDIDEKYFPILYDPQTSGGLLISIPENISSNYVKEMHSHGHAATSIIGRIIAKNPQKTNSEIIITNASLKNLIGNKTDDIILETKKELIPEKIKTPLEQPCCANLPNVEIPKTSSSKSIDSETEIPEYKKLFLEFMKEINKEHLIDKKNKKLMAIALSISQHCKPCLIIHIKSAIDMGITKAEIDEAAFLAIQFAGAPAMMFYNEVLKEIQI